MSDTNVITQARCIEIRDCSKDEPLTKRERFAMAAMQGLCANREWGGWDFVHVAQMARKQADALIAELNSTPEPA
jgi:hypothetical protein